MAEALIIQVDSSQVEKGKRSLADLASQGAKTETAIGGLGRTGKEASNGLGAIAKSASLAKLALGGFAAFGLASLAKEATMLASRYNELGIVMKVVGQNAGFTSVQLNDQEQALRKTGISMLEARSNITKLIAANIDLSKSTQLARLAQDAAVIGGLNSSDAFARLTVGIQTAQVETLRTLGLNVSFENSYKKLAATLGKTTLDLTEFEKTQARVNEVLSLAPTIAGAYEASLDNAGKQIRSSTRYLEDLKVQLGQTFNEALTVSVLAFTASLKDANGEVNELAANGQLKRWGEGVLDVMAFVADSVRSVGTVFQLTGSRIAEFIALRSNGINTFFGGGLSAGIKESDEKDRAQISKSASMFRDALEERRKALSDKKPIDPILEQGLADAGFNETFLRRAAEAKLAGTNTKKTNYGNAIRDADAIRKKREDTENKLYALEKELNDTISDREFKHLKEVRETTDKNNKIKEDNANKFYALEKELNDTISDREFKHLERVREIKENTAKDQLKAQQDLAKDINKSLTDALLRGFESGKGFAKNFRDTLVNMFKTLVLSPTISAILKPVTDSVSGILSGAIGGTGGTGSNSIAGAFSGIKNIFSSASSTITNGVSSIGKAISNFGSTGSGFIKDIASKLGGFTQLNASLIGKAIPYIGLALTAFSLIKSLSKKNSYQNGNFSSSYENGALTQTGATTNSRGALAVGALPAINELTETFAGRLGALFKTFGLSDKQNFTTAIKFGKNLEASFSSGAAAGGSSGVDGYGGKNYGSDAKAGMAQFVADVLGKGLQQAIVTSSLSDGIKGLFKGLTDQAQIVNMINATSTLQEAQKELADKFGLTVDMAGKVASASGRAGDALGEFVKALSAVAMSGGTIGAQLIKSKDKLFGDFNTVFGDVITEAVLSTVSRQVPIAAAAEKTDFLGRTIGAQTNRFSSMLGQSSAQQFQTVTEQVTNFITRIASRNLQLPKTIADYDTLLKNMDKTTLGGQKMFAEVFALRDQFIAFTGAIDGLKGNVRGALFSIVSDTEKQQMANSDLTKLFGDLKLSVPKSVEELIKLGRSIDYTTASGLDLAAAFPNLVSAFKETKDGIESLVDSLRTEDLFKSLVDFQRYTGVAGNYGAAFAGKYVDKLPSFASGTNMLPNDMVAQVHQGERIVPAADNKAIIQALNGGTDLKQLIRDLIVEVRSGNISMVQAAQKTAKVMQRIDDEGVMINETNNAGVRTVLNVRTVA